MSITIKTWIAAIAVGLVLYCVAVFYAWKFPMTGSKTAFLSSHAPGCGLTAFGVAALSFVMIKARWPDGAGVALVVALLLFVCVSVGMFYGMLNW